jgi:hypothetical protein
VSSQEPEASPVDQAFDKAYRAYLRVLRDSLAEIDIESAPIGGPALTVLPREGCSGHYHCGGCHTPVIVFIDRPSGQQ